MKRLILIMLLASAVFAQSLALVVEKSGDSITIKEMYTVDAEPPNYASNQGYHYIDVGGTKYPVDLRAMVMSEPTGELYDEKGNQISFPKPQDLYYEEDSIEEVIVVPFNGQSEVKVTDSEGKVLTTAKTSNAKSLTQEYRVTAQRITSGGTSSTATVPTNIPSFAMFFLDILAPLFEVIGL